MASSMLLLWLPIEISPEEETEDGEDDETQEGSADRGRHHRAALRHDSLHHQLHFPELLFGPVVSKAEGLPSTRPSRDCDMRVCRVSCPYPVPDHIRKLQTIFENLQFEHQIFDVDFQFSALDPL